jgi:hypothetical protein
VKFLQSAELELQTLLEQPSEHGRELNLVALVNSDNRIIGTHKHVNVIRKHAQGDWDESFLATLPMKSKE